MFEVEKQKGNKLYSSVKSDRLNGEQLKLLQLSEMHYLKAFSVAVNNDQKASVQKNLMMVELKRICESDNDDEDNPNSNILKFEQAFMRYKESLKYAKINNCKTTQWIQELENAIQNKLIVICSKFTDTDVFEYPIQINILTKLKDVISDEDNALKMTVLFKILSVQENIIDQYKQEGDYNRAENENSYYSRNVEIAYKMISKGETEVFKSLQEKYNNIDKNKIEYDAFRLLKQGNFLYQECLNQKQKQTSFKMVDSDDIWIAVDFYISLIKNYESQYFMLEGEAFAKLGFIEQEMFGNTSRKLREYIHSSVTLVLSYQSYCSDEWFVQAKSMLRTLQNEEVQREQKLRDVWKNNNLTIYNQIQDQKSKGNVTFVKWVLTTHKSPNQDNNFKLEDTDYDNMKKTLLRVIRLYHSDKIIKAPENFKSIAREIIIVLNHFFELLK